MTRSARRRPAGIHAGPVGSEAVQCRLRLRPVKLSTSCERAGHPSDCIRASAIGLPRADRASSPRWSHARSGVDFDRSAEHSTYVEFYIAPAEETECHKRLVLPLPTRYM